MYQFLITIRALKVAVTDMSIHQTSTLTAREAMNQVLHRLDFRAFQVFYIYQSLHVYWQTKGKG